ncbi:MAG: MBL fold metallo-hydrolase [Myxococcota bacterium]
MRPLYAVLDPLWSRAPLPASPRFERVRVGPLDAWRMGRAVGGRVWMWVYVYVVGDTMVDSGLGPLGEQVVAAARERGVRRAVLTHHHEDHSGNAARLLAEGVDVRASAATGRLLAAPSPVPFYEHLFWGGPPRPARPVALAGEVGLGDLGATVIPAPGHCDDQVVFHVPSEGWLFSGDVFLHERVKLFRRDEDFAATLATLERLCALDFDALYCAHRPRPERGKAALRAKLDWLREIEGRVRSLHARGMGPRAIARALKIPPNPMVWLTWGDASTLNLVRSVLEGPRPRPA